MGLFQANIRCSDLKFQPGKPAIDATDGTRKPGLSARRLNVSFSAARKGDPTAHGGTVLNGSADVFINGSPAALVGCSATSCPVHGSAQAVVQGSSTVFINNIPAVFVGSLTSCGAPITS